MNDETDNLIRCPWCTAHPLLQDYHDRKWGVWVADDRIQFEHHVLEVFQAGLSWLTMLKKREAFRAAFVGFDPERVARFGGSDFSRLMNDSSIIRNRMKIEAVIHNAPRFCAVAEEFGGFALFLERFRPSKAKIRRRESEIPAKTPEAEALSKELRARGFKFTGPTICYAHMQAVGVVNDHIESCFRFFTCKHEAAKPVLR